MKLVQNAGAIARRSHSMWAGYLGLTCLILPEILFWFGMLELSPRLLWIVGVILIAYGIAGRVVDQGIDTRKIREAASGALAAFLLIAVPLVGGFEGRSNHAYLDIVGVPTICDGSTKGVRMGDYKTDAECDELFRRELIEYREGLHAYLTADTIDQRLPPSRDAAFVSLAYNVGISGAGRSTAVRRLNEGWISGACSALTWWNKAGGRVIRGLVRRRSVEHGLCMQGIA